MKLPAKVNRILIRSGAILFSIALIFFGLHLTVNYSNPDAEWIVKQIDLDEEQNIPSWYAAILWFIISQAALFSFFAERKISPKNLFVGWWCVIAVVFCLASIDEVIELHEYLGVVFQRHADTHGWQIFQPFPLSSWLAYYLIPIVPFSIVSAIFLWRRLRPYATLLFLFFAGVTFFVIALSCEGLQGLPVPEMVRIASMMKLPVQQMLDWSVGVEETAENLGASAVFLSFLGYGCTLLVDRISDGEKSAT